MREEGRRVVVVGSAADNTMGGGLATGKLRRDPGGDVADVKVDVAGVETAAEGLYDFAGVGRMRGLQFDGVEDGAAGGFEGG